MTERVPSMFAHLFESPTARLDRLILTGFRRLVDEGIACWCAVGKHWIIDALPEVVTEEWWDEVSHHMVADYEVCCGGL